MIPRRNTSGYPSTSRFRSGGQSTRFVIASRIVTQVPSVPDKRAPTLNPFFRQQLVQVVPRHAARNPRKTLADLRRVSVAQLFQLA